MERSDPWSQAKRMLDAQNANLPPPPPIQPTDLVKVRMQSEGRLAPGQVPRYKGVFDAYSTIVRTEGILGLWTGLGPAVARNSIINATELATYEQTKEALVARGWREGIQLHVAAATAAGFMATIIGNPIDVIKTRVMAAQRTGSGAVGAGTGAGAGAGAGAGVGALATITATFRNEGPAAFYKGVLPQFFRLTGWSIVMFSTLEQLRAALRGSLSSKNY